MDKSDFGATPRKSLLEAFKISHADQRLGNSDTYQCVLHLLVHFCRRFIECGHAGSPFGCHCLLFGVPGGGVCVLLCAHVLPYFLVAGTIAKENTSFPRHWRRFLRYSRGCLLRFDVPLLCTSTVGARRGDRRCFPQP